ncbi:MAG: YaiO family outer membrane beta-barrel protein [Betaproteobacteria bacterium]|nr:MAG: YaiO family outer membrane beta-barrel protein [Betaproteobacteria bacterium]
MLKSVAVARFRRANISQSRDDPLDCARTHYNAALAALLSCTLLMALSWGAHAQLVPPGSRPTEIELGMMPQHLTGNRPDWREYYVDFSHRFGERKTLYGALRETERFGRSDTQGVLGGYYPLGVRVTGVLETGISPTHNVLPQQWLFGQLEFNLGAGWGVSAGVRHTEYDAAQVNMGTVTVEHYIGNVRAAYTLYESWLQGAGAAPAHRFALSNNYNDENQIGVAFVNGRETENVGPPTGVLTSDVTSWAIYGRHWFTRDLAVSFEALQHRQGALYTRQGARLGLRYRF